jgi:hypothetical protein
MVQRITYLDEQLLIDEHLFLEIARLVVVKLSSFDGMFPNLMRAAPQS